MVSMRIISMLKIMTMVTADISHTVSSSTNTVKAPGGIPFIPTEVLLGWHMNIKMQMYDRVMS